jgi:5-methylcytosine-specific restriction endonuclease McrA
VGVPKRKSPVPQWTYARYKAFIISKLRAGFRFYPPKFDVLKNAATERKTSSVTGKMAMHYQCALCEKEFPLRSVQVDHVKPIVSLSRGFVSWDNFIEKLFCEAKNLQVLCRACHSVKTKGERSKRGKKSRARKST